MNCEFDGKRLLVRAGPLHDDDPRQCQPDIAKTKALLVGQPYVALEVGLEETIADFRMFLAH